MLFCPSRGQLGQGADRKTGLHRAQCTAGPGLLSRNGKEIGKEGLTGDSVINIITVQSVIISKTVCGDRASAGLRQKGDWPPQQGRALAAGSAGPSARKKGRSRLRWQF